MKQVLLKGMSKSYVPGQLIVDNLDLAFKPGEFVSILGPSGCGKTTILRCIAGLETPDRGIISIGDKPVYSHRDGVDVPTHQRRLSMVFQSYALWPHMTVFDNIAFPLRRQGKKDVEAEVARAMRLVQLENLGSRNIGELSGGQQQRVSLARSLVGSPSVILFDEPLSNLDAKLREELRIELRAIHQELGFTGIYVTHDQMEALSLSDRIVVMNAGQIEQSATPEDLYKNPVSAFVGEFTGCRILEGKVQSANAHFVEVEINNAVVRARPVGDRNFTPGMAVALLFRPEDALQNPGENSQTVNRFDVRVNVSTFVGQRVIAQLDWNGIPLLASLRPDQRLAVGADASIYFAAQDVVCVPAVEKQQSN